MPVPDTFIRTDRLTSDHGVEWSLQPNDDPSRISRLEVNTTAISHVRAILDLDLVRFVDRDQQQAEADSDASVVVEDGVATIPLSRQPGLVRVFGRIIEPTPEEAVAALNDDARAGLMSAGAQDFWEIHASRHQFLGIAAAVGAIGALYGVEKATHVRPPLLPNLGIGSLAAAAAYIPAAYGKDSVDIPPALLQLIDVAAALRGDRRIIQPATH